MKLPLEILWILILGILFYQDMKDRNVYLWLLVFGILIGGCIHLQSQNFTVFLATISGNLIFIAIVFAILWLYAKIKLKKQIFEVFGAGDLLFFVLIAVSLPTVSFLTVFVFSLLFSLTVFMLFKEGFKEPTVPLAGLQSLFLGLVLIANKVLVSVNLYAM